MSKPLGLSVVLPCFNEAKSLERLVKKYETVAGNFGLTKDNFQLILVNNGSTDGSTQILSHLKSVCDFITVVPVLENQGYGYGLLQGLKVVHFETAAFSHADEQCDPLDVFRAYNVSKEEGEILVKGKRSGRAFSERLFSWGYKLCVLFIAGKNLSEINAQPKLFPSGLIPSLEKHAPKHFAFDLHVLLCAKKAGLPFIEMEVVFPPRPHGDSKWASTFRSRLRHIRLVLNYLLTVKA